MAYTVNGTTVIDNNRNLTNLANATLTGTLNTAKISENVIALGNTGTSQTLDLSLGTVFTANLTGNVTFTITNPGAATAFTLILTNDGTVGRSIAWSASGGTFRFPNGAGQLNRTTSVNNTDVWVFFTQNNGVNWYGNIGLKNLQP